ncbi:MAG: universal stress protein [Thermoleophilaceae bacterium]|nr:universal stress protein [Thermoleophilaceae bacterium]
MAGSLVVGYDGSTCGDAAVDAAIGLAADLGDKVIVVFGYEPYRVGGEIQDHRAALEEMGQRVGEAAVERIKAKGVEAQLELVDEGPAQALIDVADKYDARMLVVGSYGDSPLRGAILGSTPHKLVHMCKRPVLVVHESN